MLGITMTSYVDSNEATNETQLTTATTNASTPSSSVLVEEGTICPTNLNINATISNEPQRHYHHYHYRHHYKPEQNINEMQNASSPSHLVASNELLTRATSSSPATPATPVTPNSLPLTKKLATLPLEDFYIDSSHIINTTNSNNNCNNSIEHNNSTDNDNDNDDVNNSSCSVDNYDCDSLSDGHEKTDTTPENLNKKIDDIIDEQIQQEKHHHHHHQQKRHFHQNQHQYNHNYYNQHHPLFFHNNEPNSSKVGNLVSTNTTSPSIETKAQTPTSKNTIKSILPETSSSSSISSLLASGEATVKPTSHKMTEPSLVGLGAAIDDSTSKYCYATRSSPKHRKDKDTFWTHSGGTEQVESIIAPQKTLAIEESHHFSANNCKINDINIDDDSAIKETKVHPLLNHHPNRNSNQQQQQLQQKQQSQKSINDSADERPLTSRIACNVDEDSEKAPLDDNHDDDLSSTISSSATSTSTAKVNKQSCAFIIDHFNDKDSDPVATATKYKNMLERFQNRHRRGSSLAKMESSDNNNSGNGKKTLTSSSSASPLTSLHSSRPNSSNNRESGDFSQMENSTSSSISNALPGEAASTVNSGVSGAPSVKMRVRDRSTSRVRDASKRHSWSPRSSTTEQQQQNQLNTTHSQQTNNINSAQRKPPTSTATNATSNRNIQTTSSPSTSTATTSIGGSSSTISRSKPSILQMAKAPTSGTTIATRTQFVPRSTVMQLALQKVDFMCPEPPLADFQHLNIDADNLSDTGTYTLDGDNYTEEQKDLMNIDKSARQAAAALAEKLRPKSLCIKEENDRTSIPPTSNKRAINVLEVSYYHHDSGSGGGGGGCVTGTDDSTPLKQINATSDLIMGPHQTAGAYLDKIKSRVLRNMTPPNTSKNCDLESDPKRSVIKTADEDYGCFTSVTKSGILAKQSALDPCPKLTRRGSLSTSQIDSSEYVSNEVKMKNLSAQVYPGGSFTDHQKSEYCLNIYHNKNNNMTSSGGNGNVGCNQERFAATRSMIESPPDTPSSKIRPIHNLSDTAALKNAQSKNDWIQEWARNARARSLANERSCTKTRNTDLPSSGGIGTNIVAGTDDLMVRSYTFSNTGFCNDSLTDDSIYNNQLKKSLAARHRLLGGGGNNDCDYSSDPSLCSTFAKSPTDLNSGSAYKPPKSPTKIPSPLHSLGRARSASRARPVLQNILSPDDGEDDDDRSYLEKTAAAINNLQESLSRKGSIKSPSHINAYRGQKHTGGNGVIGGILSPEECSPHNSIGSPTVYRRSPAHRRNLSNDGTFVPTHRDLMTSSINEQQLQLLTSGEYLLKQMRTRKNSFDGINLPAGNSPARKAALKTLQQQYQQQYQQQQHQQKQQHQKQQQQKQQQQKHHANQQQLNLKDPVLSPLRRSSSFSTKLLDQHQLQQQQPRQRAARPQFQNIYTPPAARHLYGLSILPNNNVGHAITKSASSNSFRQMYSDYDECQQYYINDEDEDDNLYVEDYYSSDGEEEQSQFRETTNVMTTSSSNNNSGPLPNTRVNKALLMRMELNKQKIAGIKPTSAPAGKVAALAGAGVVACPNTPEVPRRNIKSAPRANLTTTTRQSMPRDVSLSHLATQVPNSLASAKKQLLQTAASGMPRSSSTSSQSRVQPKYLDISKYKPAQSNNFLRKNDTRSTLRTPSVDPSKRNSTGGSTNLSRTDPSRASNRSVRSMGPGMSTSASGCLTGNNNRAMSATRRDLSVSKQKETEMAMWKRRSTYDPMKAAMEDRRRKEEAKLLAKQQQLANKSMNSDSQQATSESGATPRSQRSFSSGS